MPVVPQAGGTTLQIVAPAFRRVETGSGPVHHSLSPNLLERGRLILLITIGVGFAAIGSTLRPLSVPDQP